jgi:hypothetical protein
MDDQAKLAQLPAHGVNWLSPQCRAIDFDEPGPVRAGEGGLYRGRSPRGSMADDAGQYQRENGDRDDRRAHHRT